MANISYLGTNTSSVITKELSKVNFSLENLFNVFKQIGIANDKYEFSMRGKGMIYCEVGNDRKYSLSFNRAKSSSSEKCIKICLKYLKKDSLQIEYNAFFRNGNVQVEPLSYAMPIKGTDVMYKSYLYNDSCVKTIEHKTKGRATMNIKILGTELLKCEYTIGKNGSVFALDRAIINLIKQKQLITKKKLIELIESGKYTYPCKNFVTLIEIK